MQHLDKNLNSTRHLEVSTRAAYEILSEVFNNHTDARALAMPEMLHHVYEPQQIGIPGMRLWANSLTGRGGRRTISWKWKASKQTIDPTLTSTGDIRFPNPQKGFNANKLKRIHVFVWKAPIMEYGAEVEVSPKLSTFLVYPNKFGQGHFTNQTQVATPGRKIQGNFTRWFVLWWGGATAEKTLREQFESPRDQAFSRTFEEMAARSGIGKPAGRFSSSVNSSVAGRQFAEKISNGMERNYIEMARRRRMRNV